MSDTATAADEKPKAKKPTAPKPPKAFHVFKPTGGKVETLKLKDVVRLRDAQSRDGLGQDAVDPSRVADFVRAMKGDKETGREPAEFPPIKVILVEDGPAEYKGHPTYFLFDGFHTSEAALEAGIKELKAKVYKGTISDLRAAAACANQEHDTGGKPRTNADKIRAMKMLAGAYTNSDIPKSEWPSNRQFAELVGCSRQLVNNHDPFGRSANGDTSELKKAKKKAGRAVEGDEDGDDKTNPNKATAVATPPKPLSAAEQKKLDDHNAMLSKGLKAFDIIGKATGQKIGTVYSASEPKHADIKDKWPTLEPKDYAVKVHNAPVAAAATPTTASSAFDWAAYESSIGYIVRGFDAIGDTFGVKASPEYTGATRVLNEFIAFFQETKKKFGKKK